MPNGMWPPLGLRYAPVGRRAEGHPFPVTASVPVPTYGKKDGCWALDNVGKREYDILREKGKPVKIRRGPATVTGDERRKKATGKEPGRPRQVG